MIVSPSLTGAFAAGTTTSPGFTAIPWLSRTSPTVLPKTWAELAVPSTERLTALSSWVAPTAPPVRTTAAPAAARILALREIKTLRTSNDPGATRSRSVLLTSSEGGRCGAATGQQSSTVTDTPWKGQISVTETGVGGSAVPVCAKPIARFAPHPTGRTPAPVSAGVDDT